MNSGGVQTTHGGYRQGQAATDEPRGDTDEPGWVQTRPGGEKPYSYEQEMILIFDGGFVELPIVLSRT